MVVHVYVRICYVRTVIGDEILHSVRDSHRITSPHSQNPIIHQYFMVVGDFAIFFLNINGDDNEKHDCGCCVCDIDLRWLTFVTRRWNVW